MHPHTIILLIAAGAYLFSSGFFIGAKFEELKAERDQTQKEKD